MGSPLKNAFVRTSPNVHWKVGFAALFEPRRSIPPRTGSRGITLVENLPAGEGEGAGIQHPYYRLPMQTSPWGAERRMIWIDLVSGETTKVTVRLEENE